MVVELTCAVDREGKILQLETPGPWHPPEVQQLFKQQVNKSRPDFKECSGPGRTGHPRVAHHAREPPAR